jgi:carbon starvation protein
MMNALAVIAIGLVVAFGGYRLYSRTIDRRVMQSDPKRATPATLYMDGVDFMPTHRHVLFGYQFKSIAALGPIIGPIVAVQWGWLPALLWVTLGTLLIGWVQDYSSIMIGVREQGLSFGALSYKLISPRGRLILLTFIYFYLLLIMGAFGKIVGYDLLTNTAVPLGVLLAILVGVVAGQLIYKAKLDILWTTVITVALAFGGIWLGTHPTTRAVFAWVNGGEKSPALFWGITQAQVVWSVVVMAICYLGAVLPIWSFAQPINYVSFWIVSLGVLGGLAGLVVWRPGFGDFPIYTGWDVKGLGPLWPILFVTIACGAISGWHSLVSSSGSARQLEKETDALPVGAGAMFMEMVFALTAFLAAVVGFGSFAAYKAALVKGPGGIFAGGLATFLSYIGIPRSFGVAYGSVFLTIMALTIMYLVVRFMRVASAEFVGEYVPVLKNVHAGTFVAVMLSLLLVWTGFWQRIWVLFGGANQLMASLALMLVTIWLIASGREYRWTMYPMIFMFVTTVAALLYTAYSVFYQVATTPGLAPDKVVGNVIAGAIAVFLVVAALLLAWDGSKVIRTQKAARLREAHAKA